MSRSTRLHARILPRHGVAIVGSTVRDVVYLPGRAPARSTGGSPIFAARALAALGVRPGIATRCDDPELAAPIAELASPSACGSTRAVVQSELRYREDGERDHALTGLGEVWSEHDISGWAAPALATRTWVHAGTQRGGDLGRGAGGARGRRAPRRTGRAGPAAAPPGGAARAQRHARRRAAASTCRRSS